MVPDKHQPFTVSYFRQDDVLKYLQNHPYIFEDKKFHELLIGWILAQFLDESRRGTMLIGFPIKIEKADSVLKMNIDLEWILNHWEEIIDDSDVDICIGNNDLCVKFQITRFVNPKRGIPLKRLAKLIEDKCRKYSSNPELNLLVSMESAPNITVEEIVNLLTKVRVPFAGIFLVGKHSDEIGHFHIIQLYPKQVIGKNKIIPLAV
jgi:hypothetical protein